MFYKSIEICSTFSALRFKTYKSESWLSISALLPFFYSLDFYVYSFIFMQLFLVGCWLPRWDYSLLPTDLQYCTWTVQGQICIQGKHDWCHCTAFAYWTKGPFEMPRFGEEDSNLQKQTCSEYKVYFEIYPGQNWWIVGYLKLHTVVDEMRSH